MIPAKIALHSIRNRLTPILCFAELAHSGNREAQELLVKDLVQQRDDLVVELDVLTNSIRRQLALTA